MMFDDLTLTHWDSLDSASRLQAAGELARGLPAGFRFTGLETYALGAQQHQVAHFDLQGVPFALIPGGEVTLGYDRAHPFVPTPAQEQRWREGREAGGPSDLPAYLDRCLTPLRTVAIRPFLLEVRAQELGRASYPGGGFYEDAISHREAVDVAAKEGFRLPTSDEWEHACAAGARTLFRWGNDCPTERYPAGDDRAGGRGWDLHRRPNAFGLLIAANPYDLEFCAEPGVMRGGDGGASHGQGHGFLAGWLPLASAFLDPALREDAGDQADERPAGTHLRRAFSLP